MSKHPAFLFYVDKFVQGTLTFTAEETGAYILLLCYQWDNIYIPLEEKKIKQICRLSGRNANNVVRTLLKKCICIDNVGYQNVRLEREREKLMSKSEVFRKRAEEAAKARWEKDASSNASSITQASDKQCLDDAITITITNNSKELYIGDKPQNPELKPETINTEEKEERKVPPKERRKEFVPPTIDELHDRFAKQQKEGWGEQKIRYEAEEFMDYYIKTGWRWGKNNTKPVLDLDAHIRTWIRNSKKYANQYQMTSASTELPLQLTKPTPRNN